MFLDKLNTGVTNMDLRLLLTNFHLQMQQCADVNNPPCTVESVELALSDLESRLTCRTCGARDHTTPFCTRHTKLKIRRPKNSGTKTAPANAAATTKDGSPIICFKCGGNHRPTNCPTATK